MGIFLEAKNSFCMELGVTNVTYGVEFDNVSRDEWTCLLQQFDDASIYQTWTYGSVRWGERSLSRQVVKRSGEVIAIALVAIRKVPFLGLGVAYIPWGPLWRKKGDSIDLKNLQYAIRSLRDEYAVKCGLLLRIRPNIVEQQDNSIENLFREEGFSLKLSNRRYRTLLVDLTPTIENLRKNLHQNWRRKLNQAEKKDLEIIEGYSDELYAIFLSLQSEMQERKDYTPGVSYQEFRGMQKDLPEPLKMKIMICKCEGEPMSAAVFSGIGDTGIYLFGATGDKGMKTNGSYLLHWLAMQWLKGNGCRWYDLGGINPEINPGVYQFKVGMGGMDVCHIGPYEVCNRPLSSLLVGWGEGLRSYLRR
jgi:lipid II:glycine glycyltransferase (peptidoglycan interpeptide bridge formation enzyme)